MALYIAPDGSIGVAWPEGVCVVTPMEAQFVRELLGNVTEVICHDSKATLHQLDAIGLPKVNIAFDTALAAYDLNPSQSDYPVSKLATTSDGCHSHTSKESNTLCFA
jgi:DNA polymerase I-like protein with 3'-5' exonuclease and polymerase domains